MKTKTLLLASKETVVSSIFARLSRLKNFAAYFFSVGILMGTISSASAATATYAFQGIVNDVHVDLQSTFAAGDAYSGTFTVDTTPTATSPFGEGLRSQYALTAFSVTYPNYGASATYSSGNTVTVGNDGDYGNPANDVTDNFILQVKNYSTAPDVNGFSAGNFSFQLQTRGAPPITTLNSTDGCERGLWVTFNLRSRTVRLTRPTVTGSMTDG